MTEGENDAAGDPARAFEDLRAEVAVMRRAVEALPEAWAENQPADYAPNFGWQKKALTLVLERLDVIEKHPALRQTPEQHQAAVARAGDGLMREAMQKLDRATQDTQRERQQLAGLIGAVRGQRDQRFWLILVGVMVFFCTFVLSPVIWRHLPFGLSSWSAAQIMNDDRWDAGWDLLHAADPSSEQQAAFGFNLVKANQKELEDCADVAVKTKKDQRCTITVSVAGQSD